MRQGEVSSSEMPLKWQPKPDQKFICCEKAAETNVYSCTKSFKTLFVNGVWLAQSWAPGPRIEEAGLLDVQNRETVQGSGEQLLALPPTERHRPGWVRQVHTRLCLEDRSRANTKEGPLDQTWVGTTEETPETRTPSPGEKEESLAGEETGSCDLLGGSGPSAEEGCGQGLPGPPAAAEAGAVRRSQVRLNCHGISQPWSLSCVQYAFPLKKKNQRNILKVNQSSTWPCSSFFWGQPEKIPCSSR